MVTKASRSKAQQRIDKAKKVYGLTEEKTDNFLRRLADYSYTAGVIVLIAAAGLLLWWFR